MHKEYKATAREFSIDACGYNFLCIVGEHINGGFLAILNWGVSAELSDDWNDIDYNSMCIYQVLCGFTELENCAIEIATEIAQKLANDIREKGY